MGFANLVYFFTVSLSLSLLEAERANVSSTVPVHRGYHKSLKMVTGILWGDDPSPGQNALMSPVSYARDAAFLLHLVKRKSRSRDQNYLMPYSKFLIDLGTEQNGIVRLASGDAVFNTTLYARRKDITRNINKTINNAFSAEEFSLITERKAPGSAKPRTEQNQSFAIHTKMSWNVTKVQWTGVAWSEFFRFFSQRSTSPKRARVVRTVGKYDYAEFEHPKAKDCKLKTLRLKYTSELKLNFVLLLNNDSNNCSAEQSLWTSMKDVDFRRLKYNSSTIRFVSIPVFKAIQNADLKKRLEDSPLGKTSPLKTEYFHNATLEHSLELNFAPIIPPGPIPGISPETPEFSVDHSFYFAISHEASRTPILAALIANPQE